MEEFIPTDLEPSWTPIDELNVAFRLDRSDGIVNVLGHDVAAVQQTARHILPVTRITLYHLMRRFETGVRYLGHAVLLVVSLFRRHNRRVGGQREVDARIWN